MSEVKEYPKMLYRGNPHDPKSERVVVNSKEEEAALLGGGKASKDKKSDDWPK